MHASTALLSCLTLAMTACGLAEIDDAPRPSTAWESTAAELEARLVLTVQRIDGGPSWHAELRLERSIFAPNFVWQPRDGAPDPRSCTWRGAFVAADGTPQESFVGYKACGAEPGRGFAVLEGQWYDLEERAGTVWMTPAHGPNGRCGVEAGELMSVPLAPTVGDAAAGYQTRAQAVGSEGPGFVELLFFRDRAWYESDRAGYDMADPVLVAQAASLPYARAPLARPILPVLVGIVDTGEDNPWGEPQTYFGKSRSGPYLDDFNRWLAQNQASLPAHDHATLLTGLDFVGATIGLATLEGACSPDYQGALVWGQGVAASVGQTMAHELGHTLSMSHDGDGNSCARDPFVMTPVYDTDGPFPTEFSTCSVAYADDFLASTGSGCIGALTQPTYEPRCGDGVVEGGEACDCGPLGCAGIDPCCTDTCTLAPGASCSLIDGCCEASTCQPFSASAGHVCREAQGICDVAETCDGAPRCPVDRVRPTGESCSDGAWTGSCYLGQCISRGGTCEDLADWYVFDDPVWDASCDEDYDCGAVNCRGSGQCVYLEEQAYDGTPCAAGHACFEGQCRPVAEVPGADGCADVETDTDADGVADCQDGCPYSALFQAPGACGCEPCPDEPAPDMGGTPSTPTTSGDAGSGVPPTVTPVVQRADPEEQGCGGCSSGAPIPSLAGWLLGAGLLRRRRRR